MFKKLFVAIAAAAAVSVPLAGTAWADPPADPGNGEGGVPQDIGDAADNLDPNGSAPPDLNPNGYGNPVTPGSVFRETAKVSGSNNPDAYGVLIDAVTAPLLGAEPFGPTPPGVGIKTFTPGCSHGRHLTLEGTAGGTSICS
jgi:hypothetical protein